MNNQHRSPSPIFLGVVVYVHQYDPPDQPARSRDISTLKDNGATIAANCDINTTHIICNYSSPIVQIAAARAPHIASIVHKQHLTVSDLVCKYSFGGPYSKIVLRREWIDDCIFRGRWLGGQDRWGGWSVAGVVHRESVRTEQSTQTPPQDRFNVPNGRPRYGQLGVSCSSHDLRKISTSSTAEPPTPPLPYRSLTATSADLSLLEEKAFDELSPQDTVDVSSDQTKVSSVITTANTPAAVSAKTQCERLVEAFEWAPAIFKTSTSQLLFWVDEGLETRTSVSAAIELLGGGKLVSRELATHILLALPPQSAVSSSDRESYESWLRSGQNRHVVSYEWAIECFLRQSWVDEQNYTLVVASSDSPPDQLSPEEYERFLRVFRIAKSTTDLQTALQIVANSIGSYGIDFWQTFYSNNASSIDAHFTSKVETSKGQSFNSKRRRSRCNSISSCEEDADGCSEPSGAEADVSTTVVFGETNDMASKPVNGERWLKIARSSRILNSVEVMHKERFLELVEYMALWDRSVPISTYLAGLQKVSGTDWSSLHWKYRHLFKMIDEQGSDSDEIAVTSPATPISSFEAPSSPPSFKRRTQPAAINGKAYFTRSNMRQQKPPAKKVKFPEPAPVEPPIEERRKKQDIVRGLSQVEAENYLWFAAGHTKQSWKEIADGYVAETTATLRNAATYLAWNTRHGYNETEVKVQAMVMAARDSHRSLKWRGNGVCGGCQGTGCDFVAVGQLKLCPDCRIDWDRGGTEKQRKRGLKTRRADVKEWKKKLKLDL